jgi:hypothetical protein
MNEESINQSFFLLYSGRFYKNMSTAAGAGGQ